MGTPLSGAELDSALAGLPSWKRSGNAVERVFQFDDFLGAIRFVNRIADAAEKANHHPDITINYNKVTLSLTSHDSGGITSRDVKMAAKIDEMSH